MPRSSYIVSRSPDRITVRPETRVQWRVAAEGGALIGGVTALGMAAFTAPDLIADLADGPGAAVGRLAVYFGFGALVAIAFAISRGLSRASWALDRRRRVVVVDLGRGDDAQGVDVGFDRVRGFDVASRPLGRWVPEVHLEDGQRLALGPPVRDRGAVADLVSEARALAGLEVAECA